MSMLLFASSETCDNCLCPAWCFAKHYEPDGTFNWAATGRQSAASIAYDVAVSEEPAWYIAAGSLHKVDDSGVEVWRKNAGLPMTTVAVDENHVWAATQSSATAGGIFSLPTSNPAKLLKFDRATGDLLGSVEIGVGGLGMQNVAHRIIPDGDGGVFLATIFGISHYDVDLEQLDGIGCGRTVFDLALSGSHLYAVGGFCLIGDCPYLADVIKYDVSDGSVVIGAMRMPKPNDRGGLPQSVVVSGGKVYIGYQRFCVLTDLEDPETEVCTCVLQKWDAETFDCEWETKLGEGNTTSGVRRLAASSAGIYAVAGTYLYLVAPADGSVNWCRRNEGLDADMNPQFGLYRGVAANDDNVVAVGHGTPCNSTDNDDCTSGACDECGLCSDACCESFCGKIGPFGGMLIKGCGCDEVPCSFTQLLSGRGCFESIDGQEITWIREDVTPSSPWVNTELDRYLWSATISLPGTCPDATLTAWFDCVAETWKVGLSILIVGFGGFNKLMTVGDQWCDGDNPEGEPEHAWFTACLEIDFEEMEGGSCSDFPFACCGCCETTIDCCLEPARIGVGADACEDLTDPLCGCSGLPCSFTLCAYGFGCLADFLTGQTVSFVKTGPGEWTGTAPWTCSDPAGTITSVLTYDCETDTWSAEVTINAAGDTHSPTTVVDAAWCKDDAPECMSPPGPFTGWHFTVTAEEAAEHPGIYACCCDEIGCEAICGSFGLDGLCPSGIVTTCCEGLAIPETLTATLSGVINGTFPMTYSAIENRWETATGLCAGTNLMMVLECTGTAWTIRFEESGALCISTDRPILSESCNPLEFTFSANHASCPCGSGSTAVTITA